MHAKELRPSAAHRWVKCSGYVGMAKRYPEKQIGETTIRDQGSVFHKVFYHEALGFGQINEGAMIDGIEVDDFMKSSAIEAAAFVRAWGCHYWLEERLDCSLIHPACFGTADAFGIDMENKIIHMFDPKYGFRPVHGFNNKQLGCYLAGVLKRVCFDEKVVPWSDPSWTVVFTIFQPRQPKPFRTWTLSLHDYCTGMFEELRQAAALAMSDQKTLRSGVHCYKCPGAAYCEALRIDTLAALDIVEGYEERDLNADELSYELDLINRSHKVVAARKDALEIEAHWRLMGGEAVTGYQLKSGAGRIRWKETSKDQVVELARLMGLGDIGKAPAPMAVRQAEKIVGEEFIKAHTETPKGALKLTKLTQEEIAQAFTSGINQ